MLLQNVIQIFYTVQEIEPVSHFVSEFGPRQATDDKWHLAIPSLDLAVSMCMQNLIKTFLMVQELWAIFTFPQFGPRQSLDQWKMVFGKSPWLDLVNINVYAKFHQHLP